MSETTPEPPKEDRSLPVNWERELAAEAQKAAASERPRLAAISLRGGIMSYEKVPVPNNELDVIIVASMMERQFYRDRFDPAKPASPICFAFHDGTDDVPWTPHPKAFEKQSDMCATCQYNAWGSDPHNPASKGKGCKEKRKLALLPGVKSKEMALLSVPVTSVRTWANYVNGIAAQFKRPPWGMITKIKVFPDVKTQFRVDFTPVDVVDESMLADIFPKIAIAKEVLSTPYDYQNPIESLGSDPAGPAPAAAKKKKY